MQIKKIILRYQLEMSGSILVE